MANDINVQTLMQEIRERIRRRSPPPQPLAEPEFPANPQLPDMNLLEMAVRSLHLSKSLVGELPPQPPSFRGKLGALLVKAVRRLLFWYTPQIREFQAGVAAGFDQQGAALRSVAAATQQNWRLVLEVENRFEKLQQALDTEARARKHLMQSLEAERSARAGLEQALSTETRTREHLMQCLEAETAAREQLSSRLEAETAAREQLSSGLDGETAAREQLSSRLEAETAAREQLPPRLDAETLAHEQLSSRLDAETAAREQLSSRLAAETGAREALSLSMAEKSRQADIAIQQLRAENSHQRARISILLEDVRKRTAVVSGEPQPVKLSDEDSHALDGLYAALEDRFRGSRAEIEGRQRFYLPLLEKHQIGNQRMPVLDLGCGRGEWLEILSEANLDAYGVDTNRIFIAQCREKGLRVIEEDVLQHLRSLPDSRLGGITGFHIIEHLPLDILIKLIDETVRVLKPGGLAIFETPNPQNVLVGSQSFYLDPTHRHPIPCLTAQFLLEARGLCDVEIVHLHPFAETYKVLDSGSELAQRFNDYFYGPQDYAVIGRRV